MKMELCFENKKLIKEVKKEKFRIKKVIVGVEIFAPGNWLKF